MLSRKLFNSISTEHLWIMSLLYLFQEVIEKFIRRLCQIFFCHSTGRSSRLHETTASRNLPSSPFAHDIIVLSTNETCEEEII